jgi:hypothetical protein
MADGQEIIVATETQNIPALASTPMELLSRALERGADLSMVEKLMDLAERSERNQAKKAFDAAVAEAKKELPVIKANKEGNNKKRYADQGAFAAVVDPIIANHGLSYRYRAKQTAALVEVTCVLSHRDGYSEETTLSSAPDGSGNKNSIQAIGSALTYLQRYSLKLALGLAASDDDDGKAADGDGAISEDQLKELLALKDKSGADIGKLCAYFKVEALPDLRQSQFQNAKAALQAKVAAKTKATKEARS